MNALKLLSRPILKRNYTSIAQAIPIRSTLHGIRQRQNTARPFRPIEPLQSAVNRTPQQSVKAAPMGRARRDEEISARFITFIDENGQVHNRCRLSEILMEFDRSHYFLVEVDPTAKPNPVCKLFDKKTLFEKEKQNKKKKNHTAPESVLKEVTFGWNVSDHDMEHKLNKAIQFLDKGNKVKIDIVRKKGQNVVDQKAKAELVSRVTDLLNTYKLTKKPAFNGHTCSIQFERK
ncbi:MAG: hypothetical protein EXX96DRAFT_560275 [Benjaminiella poitrasii]|nr:MAG: hypothetical protein EXX96DRAFT_560275 [Benjaminiella poitrasii]